MKRKLFLAVIAVLVLCLTCGMLLVACNDDKPNPDDGTPPVVPPEDELSAADALTKIVQNLDEVATDNTNNKEFNFGLEIVDKGNGGNVIFGLATEKYDGKDYLYGAINGPYKKFNGFDLGATVQTILGWFGEKIEIPIGKLLGGSDQTLILDAQNVINLSSTLAGMVLTKNVKAQNDGYMVELDLAKVVGLVNTATSGSGGIDGLVEPYADIINTVIGAVKEAVLGADAATPTSLSEFLNAVAAKYQVLVYFGFDGAADADKETDTSDPFGGLMRGVLAARETEAKNLLKFSVDGTVTGYENQAEGAPVANHTYTIDVDVDINPFELLAILDAVKPETVGEGEDATTQIKVDMSKEEIIDMIKKVGYISVQVNEVGADNAVIQNILTLYYNSGDYAIAALQSHPALSVARLGLGGVYDIDALIDVIGMLTAPAGGASEPQQGSDSGFDIMGLLETVMGYIDLDNIAADGVTIDFAGLVPEIVKLIMPEGNAMAEGAVMDILGSDSLNIKFGAFNFGKSEKTEAKDLIANLRLGSNEYTNSSLTENHGNYIVDITGAPGLSDGDKIGLGSDITSGMTLSNVGYEGIYLFNGTDIDGNAAVTSGIIMDVIGFDPNAPGEQTVTVYVGVVTDFYFALETINGLGVLETPIMLDPMWPLFGVLRYDATIEVVDPMANYEPAMGIGYDLYGTYTGDITSININVGQAWTAGSAEGTWGMPLDGIYIFIALRTGDDTTTDKILFTAEDMVNPSMIRITDSTGNDITADVIAANGVINDVGTYTLLLCKGGYGAEIDIIVS